MVNTESIQEILWAPVSFVHQATNKQKRIFSLYPNTDVPPRTDKNGCFYTIGLESGQDFIAHVPFEPYHESVFTVRPLNHLLPDLKEIQWGYQVVFGGNGTWVEVHFHKPVPVAVQETYRKACLPEWTGFLPGTMVREYRYSPLWNHLSEIKRAQDDYRETLKQQEEARGKLERLLTSNNNLIQQKKGEKQNVRN